MASVRTHRRDFGGDGIGFPRLGRGERARRRAPPRGEGGKLEHARILPHLAGFPTSTRRIPRFLDHDAPAPTASPSRFRTATARSPRARGPGPTSNNRRSSGVCNSLFILSAVVVAGGTLSAQSRSSWFRRSPEVSDAPIVVLNQLLVWIVCSALIIV
jgi:hypothetical protein